MNETAVKPTEPAARPTPAFEIKRFAVDEILALPRAEQKNFFTKNQIQHPEKFTRFRNISSLPVIDRYLKGTFLGTIDSPGSPVVGMRLRLDGQIEEPHFQGEITVEMLDRQNEPLSRSHLRGPLDDHIRLVEEGDRHSLLIESSGPDSPRLYQVFIASDNRQELAGNYYARNGDGKLQILGSFLLKRETYESRALGKSEEPAQGTEGQ